MSGEFQGYYDRGMKSDERDEAHAKGLLSSDNPYSPRNEIEKWLAWDTAWHRLALEVAKSRQPEVRCNCSDEQWRDCPACS
jgi:hypothetical protein